MLVLSIPISPFSFFLFIHFSESVSIRGNLPPMAFRGLYTQLFPPKPTLTEDNVPSQRGKVFIVTGGNSGVGYELCKILYGTGATIYMASRSQVGRCRELHLLQRLEAHIHIGTRFQCHQSDHRDQTTTYHARNSQVPPTRSQRLGIRKVSSLELCITGI